MWHVGNINVSIIALISISRLSSFTCLQNLYVEGRHGDVDTAI